MKKVTVIFLSDYANKVATDKMIVSRDMAKMLIGKGVAQEFIAVPQEAEKAEAEKAEAEKAEAEKAEEEKEETKEKEQQKKEKKENYNQK